MQKVIICDSVLILHHNLNYVNKLDIQTNI